MRKIFYILSKTFKLSLFILLGVVPSYAAYLPTNTGGNVGINSLAPGKTLDVQGTVRANYFSGDGSGLTNITANSGWTLGPSNVGISTTNNVGIGTATVSNGRLIVVGGNVGVGTISPTANFNVVSSATGNVPVIITGINSSQSADIIQLAKNPGATPGFVYTATGNLGVGISPNARLQVDADSVYGSIKVSNNSRSSSTSLWGISGTTPMISGVPDGEMVFAADTNIHISALPSARTDIFIKSTDGNVGVGSLAPGKQLDVQGTVRALFFSGDGSALTNVTANSGWTLGASNVGISTTNNVGIGTSFTTQAGLSVMTGYVGIGTWAPVAVLQATQGVSDFRFSEGASNLTPNMAVISTTGKAAALLAGTNGSAFNFDNSGFFNIVGDSHANFEDNLLGTGTEYLRITSTGNVGIGTTTPEGGLIVMNDNVGIGTWLTDGGRLIVRGGNVGLGTANPGQALYVAGTVEMQGFKMSTGSSATGYVLTSSSVGVGTWMKLSDISTASSSSSGWTLGASNVGISTTNNVGIGSTAPGAKMDIQGTLRVLNGNLGIGTTLPATVLEVRTSANSLSTNVEGIKIINDYQGGAQPVGLMITRSDLESSGYNISASKGGTMGIGLFEGITTNSSPIWYGTATTQNVGIGTATPSSKFSVFGGASIGSKAYAVNNAAPVGGLTIENNVGIGTFNPFGGKLIIASGNVGMGSLTPGKQLDVQGTVRATYFVGDGSGLTGVSGSSSGWTLGASNVGISTTNNVGISSTAPGAKLDVQGGIRLSGTLTGASGTTLASFLSGSWLDFPTTGPSGIGSGGAGNNAWIAYVASDGQWFVDTLTGDIAYRNAAGSRIMLGIDDGGGGANATMTFDQANVGIGTTVPRQKLDVQGVMRIGNATDYIDFTVEDYAGPSTPVPVIKPHWGSGGNYSIAVQRGGLYLQSTADTMSSITLLSPDATMAGYINLDDITGNLNIFGTSSVGIGTFNGGSKFVVNGNAAIGSTYNLLAAPTNGLIVQGNVGIASIAPGKQLDVQGTVRATYFVGDGSGLSGISGGSSGWTLGASNVGISTTNNVGIGTNKLTTAALSVMNGNVGIGTWKPDYPLVVVGDTDNLAVGPIRVKSTSSGSSIGSAITLDSRSTTSGRTYSFISTGPGAYNGSGNFAVYDGSDGTVAGYRFVINSSGLVGIGTASPLEQLHVSSTATSYTAIRLGNSSTSGKNYLIATSGSANSLLPPGSLGIYDLENTTYRMAINSAGNIGLGTWLAVKPITMVGDTYINSNVGIGTSLTTTSRLSVMGGNVGVGTWIPGAQLQVNNTINFKSEYDNGNKGASFAIDWNNGNKQKVTLTAAGLTMTFTNPTSGVGNYLLSIVQDGTGNRTITSWPGKWPGGTTPTLSTTASAIDIISCYYNGSTYYCTSSLNFL